MKLIITAPVLEAFPGLAVTGVVARFAVNQFLQHGAAGLLERTAGRADQAPVDPLEISVIKEWREAYKKMGLKSSDHRSSVESLTRRALKGGFPSIGIAAVDLYNSCSALMRAPMGGYDMDRLGDDDIVVRFADSVGDTFAPIGGSSERFPLDPRVVVYGQPRRVLCWAFNCRDSVETSVTADTTHALFLSEALNGAAAQFSRAAIEFLDQALRNAGAATELLGVADAQFPTLEIPALAAAHGVLNREREPAS